MSVGEGMDSLRAKYREKRRLIKLARDMMEANKKVNLSKAVETELEHVTDLRDKVRAELEADYENVPFDKLLSLAVRLDLARIDLLIALEYAPEGAES